MERETDEIEPGDHEVNHNRMQEVICDPGAGTTRVNQHMPNFSVPIRLFLQPKGLVLELAGDKVYLVFRGLVGMVCFDELPVFWPVKVRGFE